MIDRLGVGANERVLAIRAMSQPMKRDPSEINLRRVRNCFWKFGMHETEVAGHARWHYSIFRAVAAAAACGVRGIVIDAELMRNLVDRRHRVDIAWATTQHRLERYHTRREATDGRGFNIADVHERESTRASWRRIAKICLARRLTGQYAALSLVFRCSNQVKDVGVVIPVKASRQDRTRSCRRITRVDPAERRPVREVWRDVASELNIDVQGIEEI